MTLLALSVTVVLGVHNNYFPHPCSLYYYALPVFVHAAPYMLYSNDITVLRY